MKIYQYLQTKWISRRKCVQLIKDWAIFLNNLKIESFNQEVGNGDELRIEANPLRPATLDISRLSVGNSGLRVSREGREDIMYDIVEFWGENETESQIILFNKPKGYVVSKNDKYNQTIYEILPSEFKNKYYYIGRLDKDSHGLLVLTDDPKLVNYYEHPKNEVIKEYIVQLDRKYIEFDSIKCLSWITDEWDLLKFKSLKSFAENGKYFLNITLNEWKKRHIRRLLRNLGYHVLDLQRVREGDWELGDLWVGERIPL